MVVLPFLGIAPSLGLFFAIYTPLKNQLQNLSGLGVVLASVCAAVPASAARIPADVVQKRVVLGQPGCHSSFSTVASILKQRFATSFAAIRSFITFFLYSGPRGFFIGWRANLMSDVPFAAVKMFLFEGMAWAYTQVTFKATYKAEAGAGASQLLSPLEVAAVGMASGATTAFLTCPIDVINTHLKAGLVQERSILETGMAIMRGHGAISRVMHKNSSTFQVYHILSLLFPPCRHHRCTSTVPRSSTTNGSHRNRWWCVLAVTWVVQGYS